MFEYNIRKSDYKDTAQLDGSKVFLLPNKIHSVAKIQ